MPQFERLVQDEMPALGAHLSDEGVLPSMYCSHWFITAFAYALPFDHLLRVWDVFLLEGLKVNCSPLPGMIPVFTARERGPLAVCCNDVAGKISDRSHEAHRC